jgi:hypothetical protein
MLLAVFEPWIPHFWAWGSWDLGKSCHLSVPIIFHLPKEDNNRICISGLSDKWDSSWNVLRPGMAHCKALISIRYYYPTPSGSRYFLSPEIGVFLLVTPTTAPLLVFYSVPFLDSWLHIQQIGDDAVKGSRHSYLVPLETESQCLDAKQKRESQRKVNHSEPPHGEHQWYYVISPLTT